MMPRGKKARPRAARGRPPERRRSNPPAGADPKEWVFVPVPALVDAALFRAAQQQLQGMTLATLINWNACELQRAAFANLRRPLGRTWKTQTGIGVET